MINPPRRYRTLESAIGIKEFMDHLQIFMVANQFSDSEVNSVCHLINSFYFMGNDPAISNGNEELIC